MRGWFFDSRLGESNVSEIRLLMIGTASDGRVREELEAGQPKKREVKVNLAGLLTNSHPRHLVII